LGWWGPDGARRLVAATADPGTLPPKATWYLVTNLPRPGGPREAGSPHSAAGLAEITRIYGTRHWIDYGPRSVKRLKTRRWLGPCSARSALRVSDTSSHPSSPKSRRCSRRRKLFGRPSVPDRSHTSTAYSTLAMVFLRLGHGLDARP